MAAGKKPAGKKAGRPKKDETAVAINVSLPAAVYRQLEEWRADQTVAPPRSFVVAQAVADFLQRAG